MPCEATRGADKHGENFRVVAGITLTPLVDLLESTVSQILMVAASHRLHYCRLFSNYMSQFPFKKYMPQTAVQTYGRQD